MPHPSSARDLWHPLTTSRGRRGRSFCVLPSGVLRSASLASPTAIRGFRLGAWEILLGANRAAPLIDTRPHL